MLPSVALVSLREDMPAGRARGFRELPKLVLHPEISHPSSPQRHRMSCWLVTRRGSGKMVLLWSATYYYPSPKITPESVIVLHIRMRMY